MAHNDNIPGGNGRFLGLLIEEVENFPYPDGLEAQNIAAGDLQSAGLDKDPFEQGDREVLGKDALNKLLLLQNLAQMRLVSRLDAFTDSQYRHRAGLPKQFYSQLLTESWQEALKASALDQLKPPNTEPDAFGIEGKFTRGLHDSRKPMVRKLSYRIEGHKLDPSEEFESLMGLYVKDYEQEFHQNMQECWDIAQNKFNRLQGRGGGPSL